MFRRVPADRGGWQTKGYRFKTTDAVRHFPLRRGDFFERFNYEDTELETYDGVDHYVPVHFDYFARGGTGGKYFEMKIEPEYWGLVPVRAEHYYGRDHYVKLTLYITDRDSKGKRLPAGEYRMHCRVSDIDGNGYYVTVYFGDEAFF